jgi:hypothetical protein
MRARLTITILVLCFLWASAQAQEKTPPLIPTPEELTADTSKPDLGNAIRMFDNVVDTARSSRRGAVEHDIDYNEQRKADVIRELGIRRQRIERLDEAVGVQFDRIRQQFDGNIPAEYVDSLIQLQRQHKVMRARLESEVADLQAELVRIDQRLSERHVEREVSRIEGELTDPYAAIKAVESSDEAEPVEPEDTSFEYLSELARRRIAKRVHRIVEIRPRPVAELVVQEMIWRGP